MSDKVMFYYNPEHRGGVVTVPARANFKAYVNLCQDRPAFRRHLGTAERLGL